MNDGFTSFSFFARIFGRKCVFGDQCCRSAGRRIFLVIGLSDSGGRHRFLGLFRQGFGFTVAVVRLRLVRRLESCGRNFCDYFPRLGNNFEKFPLFERDFSVTECDFRLCRLARPAGGHLGCCGKGSPFGAKSGFGSKSILGLF